MASSLKFIGCHSSLDCTISFYKRSSGEVKAKIGDKAYSVVLPPLHHPRYDALDSTADKIQWLLKNAFFFPVLGKEKVGFQTVNGDQFNWKITAGFEGQSSAVLASGEVAYIDNGRIKLWDRHKAKSYLWSAFDGDQWVKLGLCPDGRVVTAKEDGDFYTIYIHNLTTNQCEIKVATKLGFCLEKYTNSNTSWIEKLHRSGISKREIRDGYEPYLQQIWNSDGLLYFSIFEMWDNYIFMAYETEYVVLDLERPDGWFRGQIEGEGLGAFCRLSNGLIALGTASRFGMLSIGSIGSSEFDEEVRIDSDQFPDVQAGVKSIQELDSGELAVVLERFNQATGVIFLRPELKNRGQDYKLKQYELQIAQKKAQIECFPHDLVHYEELASYYKVLSKVAKAARLFSPYSTDFLSRQSQAVQSLWPQSVYRLKWEEDYRQQLGNVALKAIPLAMRQNNSYLARRFFEEAFKVYPEQALYTYIEPLRTFAQEKELRRVFLLSYYLKPISKLNPELVSVKDSPCKRRLMVGEGGFQFTLALIRKHETTHPNLASAITATEFRPPLPQEKQRIETLNALGVAVLHGVDATKIGTYFDKRFRRIHWNCPYSSNLKDVPSYQGKLEQFFISGSQLQKKGDRIHVTLRKSPEDAFEKNSHNPVLIAATGANYRLFRKRRINRKRYPKYQPTKSESGDVLFGFHYREFVFEKICQGSAKLLDGAGYKRRAEKLCNPKIKPYTVGVNSQDPNWLYYDCSTDEDSSDYYESDEEEMEIDAKLDDGLEPFKRTRFEFQDRIGKRARDRL